MNNVVSIRSPLATYALSLDSVMPSASGRERELRCSLMLTRDKAGGALNHCCAEAAPILAHVADLAARHAFVPMPLEMLEALRYQLIRLTACAAGLETIFGTAPPDQGEPDASA